MKDGIRVVDTPVLNAPVNHIWRAQANSWRILMCCLLWFPRRSFSMPMKLNLLCLHWRAKAPEFVSQTRSSCASGQSSMFWARCCWFPSVQILYCKTVDAVDAGFSAGKSTFISSFIHATSAKYFIHLKVYGHHGLWEYHEWCTACLWSVWLGAIWLFSFT